METCGKSANDNALEWYAAEINFVQSITQQTPEDRSTRPVFFNILETRPWPLFYSSIRYFSDYLFDVSAVFDIPHFYGFINIINHFYLMLN